MHMHELTCVRMQDYGSVWVELILLKLKTENTITK